MVMVQGEATQVLYFIESVLEPLSGTQNVGSMAVLIRKTRIVMHGEGDSPSAHSSSLVAEQQWGIDQVGPMDRVEVFCFLC